MKTLLVTIIIVTFTLCLNFGLFLYAYNQLAFPFLLEEQRMENAPLIFSYVLGGFLLSAICSVVATVFLNRKKA